MNINDLLVSFHLVVWRIQGNVSGQNNYLSIRNHFCFLQYFCNSPENKVYIFKTKNLKIQHHQPPFSCFAYKFTMQGTVHTHTHTHTECGGFFIYMQSLVSPLSYKKTGQWKSRITVFEISLQKTIHGKFSCRSCRDSNLWPFNHYSGALTTWWMDLFGNVCLH